MIDAEAVRAGSVRIETRRSGQRSFEGTGFFVGTGLILTCSHVIARRAGADLLVIWSGKEFPCAVEAVFPDPFPTGTALSGGLPDLAVLRCAANNRVSLLLDDVVPAGGDAFGIFGYSNEVDGEVAFQPLRCIADGIVHAEPDWQILKLDTAGLLAGMSGCAIVSEVSGRVAAIAKRRLLEPAGRAYGIPSSVALARFGQVRAQQDFLRRAAEVRAAAQRMIGLPPANAFFVPRPADMQALYDRIRLANHAAITGEAGVGKSALAREFVSNTLDRFQEVLWIEAHDAEAAKRSLLILAHAIDVSLPPAADDIGVIAKSLYAAIERVALSWLLVLDGVEDLGLARRLLPDGPAACVVLTSRREVWTALGYQSPVRLSRLDADSAAALVSVRLGSAATGAPIAEIAAAGMGLPGETERVAAGALTVRFDSGVYPTAGASGMIPLVQRALASRFGGTLLRLLAVMDNEPLPLAPLGNGLGDMRTIAATEVLTTTSLAETDANGETIRLAPGIGEAVVAALQDDEVRAVRRRARDWLNGVLGREFGQSAPPRLAPRLLSHALRIVGTTGEPAEAADLYLRAYAARSLALIGDSLGAERLLEAGHKAVAGADGVRFGLGARVDFLLALADVLLFLGKAVRVRSVLDEAEHVLRTDTLAASDLPADFAVFAGHEAEAIRGSAFALEGRYAEAATVLQSSLLYFVKHERGSVRVATTLESLMNCLMRWGRVADALGLLPIVAAALRDTPGSARVDTLVEMYLGIAFLETAGRWFPSNMIQLGNAEAHLGRALVLADRALPEFDDVTASICVNLATVATRKAEFGKGEFARAETLLRRAIAIRRRLFGDGSPRLCRCYLNLGRVEVKLGRAVAADTLRHALDVAASPKDEIAICDELIALAQAGSDSAASDRWRDLRATAAARVTPEPARSLHPGESAEARNAALIAAHRALVQRSPDKGKD